MKTVQRTVTGLWSHTRHPHRATTRPPTRQHRPARVPRPRPDPRHQVAASIVAPPQLQAAKLHRKPCAPKSVPEKKTEDPPNVRAACKAAAQRKERRTGDRRPKLRTRGVNRTLCPSSSNSTVPARSHRSTREPADDPPNVQAACKAAAQRRECRTGNRRPLPRHRGVYRAFSTSSSVSRCSPSANLRASRPRTHDSSVRASTFALLPHQLPAASQTHRCIP